MTLRSPAGPTLALDAETRGLVRAAAVVAAGDESEIREILAGAARTIRAEWVEEMILQTYLFAGFPRALNAAREWRRVSGRRAPSNDIDDGGDPRRWRLQGETTCALVYGEMYERLRVNIRQLHPALDDWMIVEGYGKVLSRPGLDLVRRELCIVAACAVLGQERQLHSHLHGALNVGASPAAVGETLEAVEDLIEADKLARFAQLWLRVRKAE